MMFKVKCVVWAKYATKYVLWPKCVLKQKVLSLKQNVFYDPTCGTKQNVLF